jgi:hypothetical protein
MTLEEFKIELTQNPDYKFSLRTDNKDDTKFIGWYKSPVIMLLMVRVSKKLAKTILKNPDTQLRYVRSRYENPITYKGKPMYIIDLHPAL